MKNRVIRFLFWCLALANVGLAEDHTFDFQALQEGDLPHTPPAIFSSRETITFLPQIPKAAA